MFIHTRTLVETMSASAVLLLLTCQAIRPVVSSENVSCDRVRYTFEEKGLTAETPKDVNGRSSHGFRSRLS